MPKKAVVLLAEGFEEVEAVTPIDYLRRAGVEVVVAAVSPNLIVKSSRGLAVSADTCLQDITDQQGGVAALWDAVILPGGMPGTSNLAASKEATALVTEAAAARKLICAICAAPALVLAPLGILSNKKFTCYPGMEEKVQGGIWSDDRVVVDGTVITSRSAGTAGIFSIAIIGRLLSQTEGDNVAKAVLL